MKGILLTFIIHSYSSLGKAQASSGVQYFLLLNSKVLEANNTSYSKTKMTDDSWSYSGSFIPQKTQVESY